MDEHSKNSNLSFGFGITFITDDVVRYDDFSKSHTTGETICTTHRHDFLTLYLEMNG